MTSVVPAQEEPPPLPDLPVSGTGRNAGTRELLTNLTLREIRSQFKRTTLGRLWSFINPLATIAIFSLVFGYILPATNEPGTNSGVHVFALFLATALIPWSFLSGAITSGMNALVLNAGLLAKVYFPRFILPMSTILAMAFTFLIELSILLVIMAVVGGPAVFLFLPGLILLVLLTLGFCTGVALLLSIALVYFRDTQHLMAIFMQLWFYATPIIYAESLISGPGGLTQRVQDAGWTLFGHPFPLTLIYNLNPATLITGAFRSMLYDFAWPSWRVWLGCLLWVLAALAAGIVVFRRFSARVVEEL